MAGYESISTMRKIINIHDVHNRIYNDAIITNSKITTMTLTKCTNIIIRNCVIIDCAEEAISIIDCDNIEIINCHFENIRTAIRAINSRNIRITHCYCKNIQGINPRLQFAYFSNVSGGHIYKCIIINEQMYSHVGNIIDIHMSNGTFDNPILIECNYINGCGNKSQASGAILLGNNGGSFQEARQNVIINPGQYGIGCSGGFNIKIANNKVFSKQMSFSNVGIYVWCQNSTILGNIDISKNQVKFVNNTGKSNGWLNGHTAHNIILHDNDWDAAYLNADMEPEADCGIIDLGDEFTYSQIMNGSTLTISGMIKNNKIVLLTSWKIDK
jgi:hypothetical protein